MVQDLLFDPETLLEAQRHPCTTSYREDLEQVAVAHGLNERQTEALIKVFQYRCSLIQGPPSTGKTLTARAIACQFEQQKSTSLLRATTNASSWTLFTYSSHQIQSHHPT